MENNQYIQELKKQIEVLNEEKNHAMEYNAKLCKSLDQKSVQLSKILRKNRDYIEENNDLKDEIKKVKEKNEALEALGFGYMKKFQQEIQTLQHDKKVLQNHNDALQLRLSLNRLLRN